MEKEEKIKYFEYLLDRFVLWHKEVKKASSEENDITTLKAIKLLFFVTAAKTSKTDEQSLIDKVFNSFVAMPYGHVESDVYDYIKEKKGDLNFFKLTSTNTIRKQNNSTNVSASLDRQLINMIDESVDCLKTLNNNIILYSPFDLVDLSHEWYSWRKNYRIANNEGKRSQPIPIEDIKGESKIFNILTF